MPESRSDIAALQQRIAALSPEKRALFERLRAETAANLANAAIPGQQHSAERPLSLAQERLWVLDQLEPLNPAYNIALLWQFDGVLNIPILQQSLNQIVDRHESLRTAFGGVKPIQIVHTNIRFIVPIVDLQALPENQQSQTIQQLAQQTASEPFDLTQAPLLRARLLQIAERQTLLILTLHHIVADGWSRGVLLRELTSLYKNNLTGESAVLLDLPIQYSDFAVWQRQQDFTNSLTYWQQQLAELHPLDLPTDFPRPPVSQFRSTTQSLTLSPQILEALKTLSRQTGVSLFMTLLTAFKILLHRYSQQSDIAVGVPIANRHPAALEPLIGFFVNTLVLRTDLSGNPSFHALLERVRQVTASAYQHQDLPFAKLVEALHPQRHLSQNPLFQVMFQFQNQSYQLQNALSPDLDLPDLTLTQDWIDTGYTKFDLTWHLVERSQALLAVVEYRTDLYYPETIARMLGHFQVLLAGIINSPHQPISELPILTAPERQQLIDWNQTRRDADLEQFLPDRFEAQVAQTPDRIAVLYQDSQEPDQQLSYRELDSRANQLAHYLQARGITTESRVAICLNRSLEMIVALLAVLKAGAAYLPLDPSYPRERLSWMLADAQVNLLLTQADMPLNANCEVCEITRQWPQIAAYPADRPHRTLTGWNLAYLIYTSGSTGKPKGAMLTHRGLSNYLNWTLQTYLDRGSKLDSNLGAPVQSSLSFDATITSLYAPLLAGQAIVLLPERDGLEALSQALKISPFSLLKLTPAHLRLLRPAVLHSSAGTVVIGGEALTASHFTDWRSLAPNSRLINEYGPTETVVGCCVYEIPADLNSVQSIPIGRPIHNTELHILDHYLQPVPIGVMGELYIGGAGVGRGYVQRPDLTAERFIPHPFAASIPQATRLYKTGDRARYLADGTIEYGGRIDSQVKIHGFRIELEEIAIALSQHALVKAATVVLNGERLVAYIVWQSSPELLQSVQPALLTAALRQELRQFLKLQLPAYMLPTLFISLAELPLTINGKLDRASLPAPERFAVAFSEPASLSDIEAELVRIWTELLGVPVAVHHNFFELGGDSILSLQAVARAKQAGLNLTPRQLFQYQTIAELAAQVGLTQDRATPVAQQADVTGIAPLTPIQHWLLEQRLPYPNHVNQAVLLEMVPTVQVNDLYQGLIHLWRQHDALRLRLVADQAFGLHSVHAPVETPLSFIVVDLSAISLAQQTAAMAKVADALQASLDLAHTLWRSVLFHLGSNQPNRLLLVLHHWVVDGVSWRILLEDLTTIYAQIERGDTVQLLPKTTAFQAWAIELQRQANLETTQAELEYWLSQIGTLALPLDANQNLIAASTEIQQSLSIDQTHQLLEELPKLHHTRIDEILLIALTQAMQQWLGSGTLLLDLEHHGRGDLDLSRTVGWFTTIAPIALKLTSQPLVDTIKQLKETLRQIPRHGLGYGLLRYLNSDSEIQSRLAQRPAAQVKFNYLGQLDLPNQPLPLILNWTTESVGSVNSLLNSRAYLLEINAWIAQNQLQIRWVCSRPSRSTVEPVAQAYLKALIALTQPQVDPSSSYVPSDFPAARVNQKQLDQLIRKLQPGRSNHA